MNSLLSANEEFQYTLCMLGNFACFFCCLLIFSKSTFSKNSFRNTIRVSNSLDPDQARHFVGPVLGPGPSCLQKLSADDTMRQRVNSAPDLIVGKELMLSLTKILYNKDNL